MKKNNFLNFLFLLTLFVFLPNQSSCAVRTYDGAAVIRRSAPYDGIMVTVLPVINLDDNEKSNFFITKSIIGELLASGFIDVVPYRVMIEHVRQFFPDFFKVNPSEFSANPNDIDFYGNLELAEKQHLASTIGCDYIIDGIYSPDRHKSIILDLFSTKDNRVVVSFTQTLEESGSDLDAVKNVCVKIKKYFFECFSDDLVFRELTKLAAEKISRHQFMEILEKWQELYPDNLFVSAGMMVFYNKYIPSADKLVSTGERWFSNREEAQSKQIRFFKSLNFNPYYVLGNEYIKQQKYKKALNVLQTGEQTFPFNSAELKKELIFCLRLLGKHDKAEFIEKKR